MDILEFLSKSEWPVVACAALWLLRKPITTMLDRVSPTKIDAWGFKAEFERTLDKLEALTAPLQRAVTPERNSERALEIKRRSPEGVILVAWQRLESALTDVLRTKVGESTAQRSWMNSEEAARLLGLSDDEVQAIRELRLLRNNVAHGQVETVSEAEAARFDDIAWRLIGRLVSIAPKRRDQP